MKKSNINRGCSTELWSSKLLDDKNIVHVFFPFETSWLFWRRWSHFLQCLKLAEICREIARHGARSAVRNAPHVRIGRNSRLDELQAAIIRVKLKRFDKCLEDRRKAAQLYEAVIRSDLFLATSIICPKIDCDSESAFVQNIVLLIEPILREKLVDMMQQYFSIPVIPYYAPCLHLQPVFCSSMRSSLPGVKKATCDTRLES